MVRRLWLLIGVIAVGLTTAPPTAPGEPAGGREYEIKAALLYNFAKFVEWPDEAVPETSAPLTLCILGDDPFGPALESIDGKTIRSRRLVIKRPVTARDVSACHILFISSSEEKHLAQILEVLRTSSTLTIGEMQGFTQNGGIINLAVESNKVRFEINANAADRAGLKISSKLLSLASVVR